MISFCTICVVQIIPKKFIFDPKIVYNFVRKKKGLFLVNESRYLFRDARIILNNPQFDRLGGGDFAPPNTYTY